MLTLTQSAALKGSAGEPLPKVWGSLEADFTRGQLALIAAGPGTGKSAFVLNYALKSKVPCLYFSADSDAFVQTSRSLSILGGLSMAESHKIVLGQNYDVIDRIAGDSPVRFSYNPSPSLSHIESQVMAYEELYGDFPDLIVIDNALDVRIEGFDDQSVSLDNLMSWLHDMARTTEACVIVLHHVTGGYNDANQPIPLSGVKGQVGRVPELILTLHKGGTTYDGELLRVSTVKNRGSKADPTGQTYAELEFVGDKMSIADVGNTVDPYSYDREDLERYGLEGAQF